MVLDSLEKDFEQYRSEDFYKFTNLKTFFKAHEGKSEPLDLSAFQTSAFDTLFVENGKVLDQGLSIPGLKVSELSSSFFESAQDFRKNALTNVHHEMSQVTEITLEKNTVLARPLRVVYLHSDKNLSTHTLVIKAHPFSKMTLLEEHVFSEHGASVHETYVDVASGAQIEHVQLNLGKTESLNHGSTFSNVARDAQYRNVVLHLAGRLNRLNLDLNLLASGAHGESFNLYLTSDKEHSDINTITNHRAADTTSKQLAKGILDGESKGIFTGKIFIHKDAQRVAAGQLNKNLLLSKKSQAHSQPQLEIFADDVKCSHGSTTGQLSPEELFYFEARGIPREKARTLLAHGFGMEVVLKIEDKTTRDMVSDHVLHALKEKFKLGGVL